MTRVLLLGGTTEAAALARHFAEGGIDAVYSYAGRTETPAAQPLPVRIGGFGGIDGLVAYLGAESITHIVDATHPFAATMSRNAVAAAERAGVRLCAYERPAWEAEDGDDWTHVADLAGAVAALPEEPSCIFLAIGRQHLSAFAALPWHRYILRLVDAPTGALPLPDAQVVVAKGPFTAEDDTALLKSRRVNLIVAKNSGGSGARAKLVAARALGLPVIMIDRPVLPPRQSVSSIDGIMRFLAHPADLGV
ncbi:MAG: cobalt-precorrin-6A reductase [Rhodobacteraceae bacterium]|nr:cobalt-precorrin-6A reductase [Paracoccaceae bacterium]